MDTTTVDNDGFKILIHRLSQLPFIDEILLFGSRARNDHQERSDIDIAIICPDATFDDWQMILSLVEDAETLLKIDCVRFDTLRETNPLRLSIIRDKKTLYKRR